MMNKMPRLYEMVYNVQDVVASLLICMLIRETLLEIFANSLNIIKNRNYPSSRLRIISNCDIYALSLSVLFAFV